MRTSGLAPAWELPVWMRNELMRAWIRQLIFKVFLRAVWLPLGSLERDLHQCAGIECDALAAFPSKPERVSAAEQGQRKRCFPIKDMQWIPCAKDVCWYDEDKGSPAGAGGGPGICTEQISIAGAAHRFISRVYLLHVKAKLGDLRHRALWIVQLRRKPSQLPLQKAVARLTNLYHRGMRGNFTWGCDIL